ncbi:hypothetical protein O1R50_09120 [Glycomyces luteolus]|uniref:Uncharacterized protein n=1 Tax=Glycomyces luteolus TaxID=2670330 RepID=A0A9X3P7N8_9ACTN|nr:hypothetical protein [Glycomyces luteolus]MDA1359782.1 hypothetical protein [Glycomyces luteolus]
MTDIDTETHAAGEDIDWEAFAAAETQQFRDDIQAFREAANTLVRERAAECNFEYDDLLEAMVYGLALITEEFRSYSYFVTDMWPTAVGREAEDAAEHLAESARRLAAVYGQIHALPQVPDNGTTRSAR